MPNPVLLSGPAGAGKTQEARRLLREAVGPMVAADFQALLVALLLLERDPETGRYPARLDSQAAWFLPLVESPCARPSSRLPRNAGLTWWLPIRTGVQTGGPTFCHVLALGPLNVSLTLDSTL